MVDLVGIEPTTSSMPWKRAPSCATGPRSETRRIGIEGVLNHFRPHLWDSQRASIVILNERSLRYERPVRGLIGSMDNIPTRKGEGPEETREVPMDSAALL